MLIFSKIDFECTSLENFTMQQNELYFTTKMELLTS